MKRVLFDQNVPRALGRLLPECAVRTAADQGWEDLTNGDLLKAAAEAGFTVVVTADQNVVYQQNMANRLVGLIVLSTNHWPTLRTNVETIRTGLPDLRTDAICLSTADGIEQTCYADCLLPGRVTQVAGSGIRCKPLR